MRPPEKYLCNDHQYSEVYHDVGKIEDRENAEVDVIDDESSEYPVTQISKASPHDER